MAHRLRLSVLDQSPIAEGTTAGEALARSVDLAQHAESLGYTRYWMSEHHAMQTLACSAPEVVLARVGAATRSIRIGSGGIMLPHYSALKVAESFMTLEAMYPGRIDLGIGRAPGGGPIESKALRRDRESLPADDFAEQVAELRAWFGQGEGFPATNRFAPIFKRIQLSPAAFGSPTLWLLGSSLWGAAAAAQWGLPYAFAHFFSPVATRAALEGYRRAFQPSSTLAAPQATAAVGVIVAETDEEARWLHTSMRLLQQRIRQGDRRPVAPPEEAVRLLEQDAGLSQNEEGEFPRSIVGSPATVARALGNMAASLGLDEIVVNTITHSHAARLRSYSLLAQVFALGAREEQAALAS